MGFSGLNKIIFFQFLSKRLANGSSDRKTEATSPAFCEDNMVRETCECTECLSEFIAGL